MAKDRTYNVRLTGPQLRVLCEVLSVVTNDPDWAEITGSRDWATLERATEAIVDAHASRKESE